MEGHRGTQLAASILIRSTIPTAVILATGMGIPEQQGSNASEKKASKAKGKKGQKYSSSFRSWAAEHMLGALLPGLLDMTIIDLYVKGERDKKRLIDTFKAQRDNEARQDAMLKSVRECNIKDWKVDLVLTPLDGAEALRAGKSGSISSAAACAPECLNPEQGPEHTDGYFVFAIGKEMLASSVLRVLKR